MALGAGLVQQIEQAVLAELSDNRQVQIMRFLHYNLHRAFTLAELAGEMHLSPSRTSHLVKQLFGVPFQELVIGQRMLRAMHFLRATDLPVAAVGRRVGIENECHFTVVQARSRDPPARYPRNTRREVRAKGRKRMWRANMHKSSTPSACPLLHPDRIPASGAASRRHWSFVIGHH